MTITKPVRPIRNHIQPSDIKHLARHWNIAPEQIERAIETVGNSVAAVEKHLASEKGLADGSRRCETTP